VSTDRPTLAQVLERECRAPGGGEGAALATLVAELAGACRDVAGRVAAGALHGDLADKVGRNVQGEDQKRIDVVANEIFLAAAERAGVVAGVVSEELEHPVLPPRRPASGRFLLAVDPLDGSSNVELQAGFGSLFSVMRAPDGRAPGVEDFLQPGSAQVCAGYAVYGVATAFVVALAGGVHGFTLDPRRGEFVLTRPAIEIPSATAEFAVNASNARFWPPAVKRYVDECLAGATGPRGRDFNMRWHGCLVAELHRVLLRGGIYLYPRDGRDGRSGRLRILYEIHPTAFLVERAGGAASTGIGRALDVAPAGLHERGGLVFGSREEVARLETYHVDHDQLEFDSPLFGARGLFRSPV